jgi:hypothetical protein
VERHDSLFEITLIEQEIDEMIDPILPMDVTTLQWEAPDGKLNFKVFCIQATDIPFLSYKPSVLLLDNDDMPEPIYLERDGR